MDGQKSGCWEGCLDGSNRGEKRVYIEGRMDGYFEEGKKEIDGIYLTHPSKTLVVALKTTLR